MGSLDACPLCRTQLGAEEAAGGADEGGAPSECPECGADLAPYLELDGLGDRYLKLARELISRGQMEQAREIVEHLPQIVDAAARPEYYEVAALIAIYDKDFHHAASLAGNCEDAAAIELREQIELHQRSVFYARELYNHALSSARKGELSVAAKQLARAVDLDASDPALWELKLKLDLKCGYYQHCYADLAALDSLVARPPEYAKLEEALPPVNNGVVSVSSKQ
ncbi:hypothetical protein IIA79_01215 [bacterium]|nr:hypothetical protein [bacterium]